MQKKLYKARYGIKIDGVCAGLAYYMDMDPTIMRLIWVAGTLIFNIMAIVAYFVCSLVMPREPEYYGPADGGHGYYRPDEHQGRDNDSGQY